MPYYRCPQCAMSAQIVAGRFTTRVCPRCSVPLELTGEVDSPDLRRAAISRRLLAEPQAASVARRQLNMLLGELGPGELQITSLLTTELIANAVEHGSSPSGTVRLDVSLQDDVLRVRVGDEGGGFEPASRRADAPLDSQWGLHLVESLADRWGVATEPQTVVWFELDVSRSAQAVDGVAMNQMVSAATVADPA